MQATFQSIAATAAESNNAPTHISCSQASVFRKALSTCNEELAMVDLSVSEDIKATLGEGAVAPNSTQWAMVGTFVLLHDRVM